jgi:hypothetical protein
VNARSEQTANNAPSSITKSSTVKQPSFPLHSQREKRLSGSVKAIAGWLSFSTCANSLDQLSANCEKPRPGCGYGASAVSIMHRSPSPSPLSDGALIRRAIDCDGVHAALHAVARERRFSIPDGRAVISASNLFQRSNNRVCLRRLISPPGCPAKPQRRGNRRSKRLRSLDVNSACLQSGFHLGRRVRDRTEPHTSGVEHRV